MTMWEETANNLPGFRAAGLFDGEGLIVDGYGSSDFSMEPAAAAFTTVLREADDAGRLTAVGSVQEVQVQYDETVILLRPLAHSSRRLTLGLAADRQTPLGRVRLAMDVLARKLAKVAENRTAAVVSASH